MLRKLIRNIKDYLYDSSYELDRRLFYLVIGLGTFVSLSGVIVAVITHAPSESIISMLLYPVVFTVFGGIAAKYNCINFCAVASSLVLNLFIFPMLFFTSGSVGGGLSGLFVLGILYVFLLVKGIAFIITFILSAASFTGCYIMAYYHNVYIKVADVREVIYIHTFVCFMLV